MTMIGRAARLGVAALFVGSLAIGAAPAAHAASGHVPRDTVMRELLRVQTDEYDTGRSISSEFPIWASPGHPDNYPTGMPYRVYGNDTVHVILTAAGMCVHITNPLAKAIPYGVYYDESRDRATTFRPAGGPCSTIDVADGHYPRHTALRELDKAFAAELSQVNGEVKPAFALTATPRAAGRYPSGAAYHVYGADSVHVAVKGSDFCVHVTDPLALTLPHGAFHEYGHGVLTERPSRGLCATVR